MITKKQYLRNPCRASSLPYWKTAGIAVPEHMKIVHEGDFSEHLLEQYEDDTYFRLKHDLQNVAISEIPAGYRLAEATVTEFADHINGCYENIGITAEELLGYREREAYCPKLWLAIRDKRTGEVVATGIGEFDRELGEGVLEWIQVSKAHRGQGLGKAIVTEMLQRMHGMADFATVSGRCGNPTNPEALYRTCGFAGNDVWHILRKRRNQ